MPAKNPSNGKKGFDYNKDWYATKECKMFEKSVEYILITMFETLR